jgi:hypothetical protein
MPPPHNSTETNTLKNADSAQILAETTLFLRKVFLARPRPTIPLVPPVKKPPAEWPEASLFHRI